VARTTYFSFSRTARTRVSARVRERAWLSVRLYMDGFSSNLRWTYYKSYQVAWATYFSYSRTARACVSARVREHVWLNFRLYMDGFSSNLRWTYYKSQQVARATFMFTHRAHAYERARGYTFNNLWRIFFKLMGTYYKWPQVTWDTYLTCSSTACTRASMCVQSRLCERARD
jgi:hypothetical protein